MTAKETIQRALIFGLEARAPMHQIAENIIRNLAMNGFEIVADYEGKTTGKDSQNNLIVYNCKNIVLSLDGSYTWRSVREIAIGRAVENHGYSTIKSKSRIIPRPYKDCSKEDAKALIKALQEICIEMDIEFLQAPSNYNKN
jgi:hypothetical protein